MRSIVKIFIGFCVFPAIVSHVSNAQVTTNTVAIPPISPYINQAFTTTGPGIHLTIFSTKSMDDISLYGSLERISPAHFSISVNDNKTRISITAGVPIFVDNELMQQAFAYFTGDLNFEGVSLDQLQEGSNYRLPEGLYTICFYVKSDGQEIPGSKSCATFYICNIKAPQFTQPVNNLMANSSVTVINPSSPVVFSWLPPQSSCGTPANMINYDFEIREILDDQSITDALNNPYVFHKSGLSSNTFLLDTNLYQNVLQQGEKYIIQVRARAMGNPPPSIENDGFSRVEAFQYGGNIVAAQNNLPEPDFYYLPFIERKTDFWDDYRKTGKDTLVPVKEYVAFALMETGIAYNLSAIELFIALNPELANQKTVKLSYVPQLPVFPEVPETEKKKSDAEHQHNLQPDSVETGKFNQYLSELTALKPNVPGNAVEQVNDLISYLNNFKTQLDDFNRVSVNFMNEVLAEIVYDLRSYTTTLNTNESDKLQSLISTIKELGTVSTTGSFLDRFPGKNKLFLNIETSNNLFSYAARTYTGGNYIYKPVLMKGDFAAVVDPILPFNIIVWRKSKQSPYIPVTNAPDLTEAYRIMYTLNDLYNHKNPTIGMHTSNDLASTIQVSLPTASLYKFWTRSMITGKSTEPERVDLGDINVNSKKNWPYPKKPSVILQVE